MEIAVIVKGDKEVINSINKAAESIDSKALLDDYLTAAKWLQASMKAKAPVGEGHTRWKKLKGARSGAWSAFSRQYHLKDAILARKYKSQKKGNPKVYVMVSDRIAPHRRIVEWGTGPRYNTKWSKTLGRSGGQMASRGNGAYRGIMPAKPYFRPAIDYQRRNLEQYMEEQTWKRIQEAFR